MAGMASSLLGLKSPAELYVAMMTGNTTFDRIVENVRRVADRVAIAIGGNFDESSADSFPGLLDKISTSIVGLAGASGLASATGAATLWFEGPATGGGCPSVAFEPGRSSVRI